MRSLRLLEEWDLKSRTDNSFSIFSSHHEDLVRVIVTNVSNESATVVGLYMQAGGEWNYTSSDWAKVNTDISPGITLYPGESFISYIHNATSAKLRKSNNLSEVVYGNFV